MINKDSIVTAYDEHLTLVEWLQKVQTALKDAVLTGVTINKKGNATLSFVFTFEDGTTLETDDLILQQGESVASAYISNGNLHIVLTNGDDLDAGNMFNGNVVINGSVSTPILTTANDHIEAQKPILQPKGGLSVQMPTITGLTKEIVYIGSERNGNKITFVVALNLTRTGDIDAFNVQLVSLGISSAIGSKLIPSQIGPYSFLDVRTITAFLDHTSGVIQYSNIMKTSNNDITFNTSRANLMNLQLNTKYYYRYEATFLLSASAT